MLNLNTLVAFLIVVNRTTLTGAVDNCKISVQINTMVLHVTAARQALQTFLVQGAELNSGAQYHQYIPAILSPSNPGLKSCSASLLSCFRLSRGNPHRARWRDWSTVQLHLLACILNRCTLSMWPRKRVNGRPNTTNREFESCISKTR